MELSYSPVAGKSRGYKILVAILVALTVAGFSSFIIAYLKGHQMFGSSNAIPWGLPIVVAIYLIGLSAGLHILGFLIYMGKQEHFRPVLRMAVFMGAVLIFGAMIAILLDLGRPEKSWRLFMLFYLNNMSSMFAINGIFYPSFFLSDLIYLGSLMANAKKFSMTMGMIAFGWAMLTHGGTGAIFGFIATRGTWFSALSPFEFILAAFTSSLAFLILILLAVFKLARRALDKKIIAALGGLLKAFIIGLLLLMFVANVTHSYSLDKEPTLFMLFGPFSWLFWGPEIFLGMVVPLVILFHPRTKNSLMGIVVASSLVVIGIFFKRFYLVIPGLAFPLQFYPGTIEGVWGQVGSFSFTPVEVTLSLGIFSFLALIFVLGLKLMPLLPDTADAKTVETESTGIVGK